MKKRKKPLTRPAASPRTGAARAEGTLVISQLEQLKALTHPLRQELFEHFAVRPATTKQLADSLGHQPTRLYHHVAKLEKAGLIRLVSTRQVRGTTEKYYSAVAKKVSIDPTLVSGRQSDVEAAGLGVLDGLFAKARNDVADLLASTDARSEDIANEVMFAQLEVKGNSEKMRMIRARLDALLQELAEDSEQDLAEHDPSKTHRLLVGWYPRPKSTGE